MPAKHRQQGVIPLAVLGISFLVLSLAAITVTVNDPLKKQLVSSFAKGKDKAEQKARDYQQWATNRIKRLERQSRGECDGAQCVAQDVVKNTGYVKDWQTNTTLSAQQKAEQKILQDTIDSAAKDPEALKQLEKDNPELAAVAQAQAQAAAPAAPPAPANQPSGPEEGAANVQPQSGGTPPQGAPPSTSGSTPPTTQVKKTFDNGLTRTYAQYATDSKGYVTVTPLQITTTTTSSVEKTDAGTIRTDTTIIRRSDTNQIIDTITKTTEPLPTTTRIEKTFDSGTTRTYAEYSTDSTGKVTVTPLQTTTNTSTSVEKTDEGFIRTDTQIVKRTDTNQVIDSITKTVSPTQTSSAPTGPTVGYTTVKTDSVSGFLGRTDHYEIKDAGGKVVNRYELIYSPDGKYNSGMTFALNGFQSPPKNMVMPSDTIDTHKVGDVWVEKDTATGNYVERRRTVTGDITYPIPVATSTQTITAVEKTDEGITRTQTTIIRRSDTNQVIDSSTKDITSTSVATTQPAQNAAVQPSGKSPYDPPAFNLLEPSTYNPKTLPNGKYYNGVTCGGKGGDACGSGYCGGNGFCADKPAAAPAKSPYDPPAFNLLEPSTWNRVTTPGGKAYNGVMCTNGAGGCASGHCGGDGRCADSGLKYTPGSAEQAVPVVKPAPEKFTTVFVDSVSGPLGRTDHYEVKDSTGKVTARYNLFFNADGSYSPGVTGIINGFKGAPENFTMPALESGTSARLNQQTTSQQVPQAQAPQAPVAPVAPVAPAAPAAPQQPAAPTTNLSNFQVFLQRSSNNTPINNYGGTSTSWGCGPSTALNILKLTNHNLDLNKVLETYLWTSVGSSADGVLLSLRRNGFPKDTIAYGESNRIVDANDLKNYTGILVYAGKTNDVDHIAAFDCTGGRCFSLDSYFGNGKPQACTVEASNSVKCEGNKYLVGETGGVPAAFYPVKTP